VVAISTAIVAIRTFTVSERTLQANTRQQTSDRFVKAIEQLGNDKSPDVRIGGIYGLEQLARDSPSDQPAVFDVLTTFVRGRVPAGAGKCADPSLHLDQWWDEHPNASPSDDVLAAVGAIARRDPKYDRKDKLLDLSHTCLLAAQWAKLQLLGLSFEGADLRDAVLTRSDLRKTVFLVANSRGHDSRTQTSQARNSSMPTSKMQASIEPTSPGQTSPEPNSPGHSSSQTTSPRRH
jgi:hypothetical protein